MLNKKGQFEFRKSIYWTIIGIVITMVVFMFAFTISSYKSNLTKVPVEIRSELITLRFVNSPDCFAYQDKNTGRVFPGVIDMDKFSEEQLRKCYFTESERGYKDFNFRIVLESSFEELVTNNYFYDDKDELTLFKEVLIRKQSGLFKDQLIIYVQEKI